MSGVNQQAPKAHRAVGSRWLRELYLLWSIPIIRIQGIQSNIEILSHLYLIKLARTGIIQFVEVGQQP